MCNVWLDCCIHRSCLCSEHILIFPMILLFQFCIDYCNSSLSLYYTVAVAAKPLVVHSLYIIQCNILWIVICLMSNWDHQTIEMTQWFISPWGRKCSQIYSSDWSSYSGHDRTLAFVSDGPRKSKDSFYQGGLLMASPPRWKQSQALPLVCLISSLWPVLTLLYDWCIYNWINGSNLLSDLFFCDRAKSRAYIIIYVRLVDLLPSNIDVCLPLFCIFLTLNLVFGLCVFIDRSCACGSIPFVSHQGFVWPKYVRKRSAIIW